MRGRLPQGSPGRLPNTATTRPLPRPQAQPGGVARRTADQEGKLLPCRCLPSRRFEPLQALKRLFNYSTVLACTPGGGHIRTTSCW